MKRSPAIPSSKPGKTKYSLETPTVLRVDPGVIPGWEDSLDENMATHCNILTWRIPWTEEPGRIESTWSQRVGQD